MSTIEIGRSVFFMNLASFAHSVWRFHGIMKEGTFRLGLVVMYRLKETNIPAQTLMVSCHLLSSRLDNRGNKCCVFQMAVFLEE